MHYKAYFCAKINKINIHERNSFFLEEIEAIND